MGGPTFRSVWDVVSNDGNLEVRCGAPRCTHRSVIDAVQLARKVQLRVWNASLEALEMRMRCSRCWHLGGYMRPTNAPITGPKVGPASEAEAKARARMMRS